MSNFKRNFHLLFERPHQPVFIAKGPKKTAFKVCEEYLKVNPRYKCLGVSHCNSFDKNAEELVEVKRTPIPSFDEILELKRDENFSLFIPKHRRLAGKLIDIFWNMPDLDHLLFTAMCARDCLNPYLFHYALTVAMLHRPDTKDMAVPTFVEFFPDKFVDAKALAELKDQAILISENSRKPIEVTEEVSDKEVEHRLMYFREDMGVNLHHWHWHLVYPHGTSDLEDKTEAQVEATKKIVDKDRRGELFYYMHQQVIARYNYERLCNDLKKTKKLDWTKEIEEAYFPKLGTLKTGMSYAARVANQKFQDLDREEDKRYVDELKKWSDQIYAAIHHGSVIDERGCLISLTESKGIDILGNIIESSALSHNRTLYEDLHNTGHDFIGNIHDPDNRHLKSLGVMGDSAMAMRDPVFYRWHTYIDDMFQEYKATLPRYSESQLNYPGITVSAIEVQSHQSPNNTFSTFWQKTDLDLSKGLDFDTKGPIYWRFKHLQHQPFTYKITVNNHSNSNKKGTCRIFLAPKYDETGKPWSFRDQKIMFIELDKFTIDLERGQKIYSREDHESTVTISFEKTFRKFQEEESSAEFNFCGCGWPHHMLIPKGTPEGFASQLFVMISNYEDDKVAEELGETCNDAGSYCGIKNKMYPDRRAMGYPFDRLPRNGVDTLQEFLTPNMRVQDVTIKFSDRIDIHGPVN